jgi:hypothetical protein
MSQTQIPESLSVSFTSLVNLAIEQWRLAQWLQTSAHGASAGPARHALRKLQDFLKSHELEVQTLDGRVFDAGLAARVVDTVEDRSLPADRIMIVETLAPMVLWRGQVVRPAEVVTAQRRA